jgi:hypothetical protein
MSDLDALLIEKVTQGINRPTTAENGFIAVAASGNYAFADPDVIFYGSKLGANLTDANTNLAVADGNARIVPAATLTANRSDTLQTTGATTGESVTVYRLGTEAFTLAILNGGAGAGTKYTFPVSVARAAEFTYDGTNWQLLRHWAI